MCESSIDVAPGVRASERVVVHVNSSAARWVGASAVFSAACWLVTAIAHGRDHAGWHATGRVGWSLTALAAVALIARGIFLGRPVTAGHAAIAVLVLSTGIGAHVLAFDLIGDVLIAGSGLALTWPASARGHPDDLSRVWALINATAGDPLAPFAMQAGKCYLFSADQRAALAYRTRIGFAVVSGDPVGDEAQFPALVADFAKMCHTRGWRIVVLACSEHRLELWTDPKVLGQALRPIPIGRDVVIDVATFDMVGRKFRNLRQAVKRTHNCGITTEIVDEQELDGRLLAELTEVLRTSVRGGHTDRGYCMNLDGVLEGRYPGVKLIIARDKSGRVQGFHRYATAGHGRDITLDVPWRRSGAPNGIDERLSIDMINAAKDTGAQRVSLAFAAFPEIFDQKQRGRMQGLFYWLIHLLNPLIALESLYRYLRKFHSPGQRRYALVSLRHLVPLIYVMLSLEFTPRRRNF
ncbi:bifunctional lysylphosphatidylglycerol flippase/synthetase MprF [Candidatus Mycobacterium methanotrophicum]|uniref:Phosphatidylglycerol lysyltransferase domain-containing protein n=1 Tax=Candidatus Mycobacterium methanotrophicum TaxID=2943498 RepID=A0ABY4QPC9_9MYCO|nr:phosphatidylglycerol lysyltransferase domain-containing protein [Candidatus Mycobacterium methanotrophicum]UQX12476.1 phosphatidylglycerol lysyltransferase domain-containing protein [Candidatus Mycobacterium methanotrophicum]